jgi:hypothetical protein
MLRGFIYTTIYAVVTLVLPMILFSWLHQLTAQGLPLGFDQQEYQNLMFWITAFGLIICGCAFFTHSSPKKSIRRACFALIQVIVNGLYIWSYRLSGATNIEMNIGNVAFFALDLSQMILLYMGIYFLTIVLKVYDIIDFSVNRKKIRENRMKA